MSSKGTFRLITTFLCISFLFVFFQCTSSQPVSTSLLKANINNNYHGSVPDSLWIRPLSYSDFDELNIEDNNSEDLSQLSPKHLLYNKHDENNRPSSSLVRRANFWKRANFWRKRANFWRRDLVV